MSNNFFSRVLRSNMNLNFLIMLTLVRDRPFNLKGGGGGGLWFFVSFRIFSSDNTRVRIFILFVAQSANFFPQNSTLGYMTKTQIIFFPPSKSEYFFQQHWESEYFF